ncbi:MAG TPA: ribonuclease HI family protein [Terriglobales bacterium]|nr:ribonuclease HI family protein [Terriglobales bacterium]
MNSSFRGSPLGRSTNPDLFDTHTPKPPERHLVAFSDGGARGNPGPSGYGVVIQDETGKKVAALSEYLGHQTNNFAEYQGLIAALEYAVQHGHKALRVISDSELLVRQIKGIYKVKNAALQDLYGRAKELIAKLDWFSIGHVLRGKNQEADALANAAMDQGMGRAARTLSPAITNPAMRKEFNGIVRDGKIELVDGKLADGTQVQVRVKS